MGSNSQRLLKSDFRILGPFLHEPTVSGSFGDYTLDGRPLAASLLAERLKKP
jgi:hypothetical protein